MPMPSHVACFRLSSPIFCFIYPMILYYSHDMASCFKVGSKTIIQSTIQLGYKLGIFLVLPNIHNRNSKYRKMEAHNFTTPCSYSCHFLSFLLTILLFITTPQICLATTATSSTQTYQTYIKTTCTSTLYPQLCYKSLSPYASQIQTNAQTLCTTALNIALKSAQNTSSMVSKVSKLAGLSSIEVAVIKDCIDNVKGSISELQDSLNEMGQLSGPDVAFRVANVKTWVSAALTDETTCTDGLSAKNVNNAMVKNTISEYILSLAQLTSNALALINGLKY